MTLDWLMLSAFGFFSGVQHAFDADHVAAVSNLVSEHASLKKGTILGMVWGLGHTLSLLVVGLLVVSTNLKLSERVTTLFEIMVGSMLIILGIQTIVRMKQNRIHIHTHHHGRMQHIHFHAHLFTKAHHHLHRSFGIGIMHGLAGSGAVTMLVLVTISSIGMGLAYIGLFGIGSILGMMLVSSIIAVPFTMMPKRLERTHTCIKACAGIVSILLGMRIVYTLAISL